MEDQKTSSKKVIINFGILLGILSVLISVVNYILGLHLNPHWIFSLISFTITAVIIVLGIKKFKKENNHFLKLTEALKIGIGICLISGIIGIIWILILTNFLEPEYYTLIEEVQKEQLVESFPDFNDDQIEQQMSFYRKLNTPYITSAVVIIVSLFTGFIISLIAGLAMQKKQELY